MEDAWDPETVVGEAGVTWEGGEVEVVPEPPGSSDPPPQAASAVIAKMVMAMTKTRV